MKIVIVGAPSTGKADLAVSLIGTHNACFKSDHNLIKPKFAIGDLADYRAELKLAIDRVIPPALPCSKQINVYTHSLLDSVAYTTVRIWHGINSGVFSEQEIITWQITLNQLAVLVRDSFDADLVLFNSGNDGSESGKWLEDSIKEVLNQFDISFEVLEGDTLQKNEKTATIIQSFIKESDDSTTDKIGSDLNGED